MLQWFLRQLAVILWGDYCEHPREKMGVGETGVEQAKLRKRLTEAQVSLLKNN